MAARHHASDAAHDIALKQDYAFIETYMLNILESTTDAILTVDENQRIVLFNTAAETLLACSRQEALGCSLSIFIPPQAQTAHEAHIQHFTQEEVQCRRMSPERVVRAKRYTGEEFPVEVSISRIQQNGQSFYTAILRDITEQINAEEALRQSQKEIQELALAAHCAREQEKARIAREMHDELGQLLTALKMDISWLNGKLPEMEHSIEKKLSSMQNMLDRTVAVTRRISSDLRPLILDDLGLVAALEWITQSFTEHSGVRCKLCIPKPDALILNDLYATVIFRIVQESLTNISKHAKASQVEVTIEQKEGYIILKIHDDGIGFSPNTARKPNSYGLLGLKERTNLLGGTIIIHSLPGQGTAIQVHIPLSHEQF
jgi:PAS domain S-box-containing protein